MLDCEPSCITPDLEMAYGKIMVALERTSDEPYLCTTGFASLTDVANTEKLLPPEFINGAGNMVSQAFWTYADPLVDGPLPPLARLQGTRVAKRVLS